MGKLRWLLKTATIFAILSTCVLFSVAAYADNYYVSTRTGDDSKDGKSTATPWKTVAKVNSTVLKPGDIVNFECGDVWRESLNIVQSGSSTAPITYTSYGTGNKPVLNGAFIADPTQTSPTQTSRADTNTWQLADSNYSIWKLKQNGTEKLTSDNYLHLWSSPGTSVNASLSTSTSTGSRIDTINCINSGTNKDYLQLFTMGATTSGISVKTNYYYMLTFDISSSSNLTIPAITLQDTTTTSYKDLASLQRANTLAVAGDNQFHTIKVALRANADCTKAARIDFALGGAIPANTVVSIKNFSFKEMDGPLPIEDVGNIIFSPGNGVSSTNYGIKVQNKSDLTSSAITYLSLPASDPDSAYYGTYSGKFNDKYRFWYDISNFDLYVCADMNSTNLQRGLTPPLAEIALGVNIINQWNASYIVYNNLELKNGGKHGILVGGDNTSDYTTIAGCTISYIGGCYLYDSRTSAYQLEYNTPYGNLYQRCGDGIEFWKNSKYDVVTGCTISQIYDGALSNQGEDNTAITEQAITFDKNIINNCEVSYEFEISNSNSYLGDIHFTNNTCSQAGIVWSHDQRPKTPYQFKIGRGVHVNSYTTKCRCGVIDISNNTFDTATNTIIYISKLRNTNQYGNIQLNNNIYIQPYGNRFAICPVFGDECSKSDPTQGFNKEITFPVYEFDIYKSLTQKDSNSKLSSSGTAMPGAPTDLHLSNRAGRQVQLSWTPAADANQSTKYHVTYARTASTGVTIDESIPDTQSTYKDWTFDLDTINEIYVTAVNGSTHSNPTNKLVLALDATPPSIPGGISYTATNNSITISWSPSTDNLGVVGYRIYDSKNNFIGTTPDTHYTINGLSSNTQYTFYIQACDTGLYGSGLAQVNASTL